MCEMILIVFNVCVVSAYGDDTYLCMDVPVLWFCLSTFLF